MKKGKTDRHVKVTLNSITLTQTIIIKVRSFWTPFYDTVDLPSFLHLIIIIVQSYINVYFKATSCRYEHVTYLSNVYMYFNSASFLVCFSFDIVEI